MFFLIACPGDVEVWIIMGRTNTELTPRPIYDLQTGSSWEITTKWSKKL